MATIRELMNTDLVAVDRAAPVAEAARRMKERSVGDVLVTDRGKISGILTDRDIVVRCVAERRDPASTPVGSICSGELATLSPDDALEEAIRMMEDRAIRRIPVVEGERAIGIVSLGDLAVARDRRSALGQISAAPPNA